MDSESKTISDGNARYYGHQAYVQDLRNQLAFSKAVAAYCSEAKAYADAGYQDVAEDLTMIEAGTGIAESSILTGPLAPFVVSIGGILIAVGAARLAIHSSYVLAKINANANGMPLSKFPAPFDRPLTGSPTPDYIGGKQLGKTMDGGADLGHGKPFGFGFPGSDECARIEESQKKTEKKLQEKIDEATPPPAIEPQIKPAPTPRQPTRPPQPFVQPPIPMPHPAKNDGSDFEPHIPQGDGKGYSGPDKPTGGIFC